MLASDEPQFWVVLTDRWTAGTGASQLAMPPPYLACQSTRQRNERSIHGLLISSLLDKLPPLEARICGRVPPLHFEVSRIRPNLTFRSGRLEGVTHHFYYWYGSNRLVSLFSTMYRTMRVRHVVAGCVLVDVLAIPIPDPAKSGIPRFLTR